MKVAIIGAGNVGHSLAQVVAGAGHSPVISALDQERARAVASETGGTVADSNVAAAREADMVVLAVPYDAVDAVGAEIADATRGKVVVDATNPIRPDLSGLAVGERSGAEHVQELLPSASVVKAFNTVLATNQADPHVNGVTLDGFVAGDDRSAKETVMAMMRATGYRPIDVGGLATARALEQMAYLNILLNARNNWPWQSGWKLVGPTG